MKPCVICSKPHKRRGKLCSGCLSKTRRHRLKLKGIELLKGKCERCGYNANPIALQFHHKDPKEKLFTISSCANKSWKSMKAEILKCELLCANCHTIEHSNRVDKKFLNYIGL